MSFVDVLVFIPLIPLIPVVITWWLPWARWLPRKLPKYLLGPYLFYAAFAAWYFRFGPLVVTILVLIGVVVLLSIVIDKPPKP